MKTMTTGEKWAKYRAVLKYLELAEENAVGLRKGISIAISEIIGEVAGDFVKITNKYLTETAKARGKANEKL